MSRMTLRSIPQHPLRFIIEAQHVERDAQMRSRIRVVRPRLCGPLQRRDSLLPPALPTERDATVHEGVGVVWADRQRLIVVPDGLHKRPDLPGRDAHIVEQFRIARLQRQSNVIRAQRRVEIALRSKRKAQDMMRVEQSWVVPDEPPTDPDGRVWISGLNACDRLMQQRARIQTQRPGLAGPARRFSGL